MKKEDRNSKMQKHQPGADWPSGNPFVEPDGYFNSLPDQVNEKIHSGKNTSQQTIFHFIPGAVKIAFAFVIVAIGSYTYFNLNYTSKSNSSPQLVLNNFDSFSFVSELEESDIIDAYTSISPVTEPQPDNALEDFLLENNVEDYLILNEL